MKSSCKVGVRSEEVGVTSQVKFAGAIHGRQADELRDTGMSRLRRVNRLCSSTLSDAANMLSNGSTLCSPTIR